MRRFTCALLLGFCFAVCVAGCKKDDLPQADTEKTKTDQGKDKNKGKGKGGLVAPKIE
jgi:hypothetical protein